MEDQKPKAMSDGIKLHKLEDEDMDSIHSSRQHGEDRQISADTDDGRNI